ncbi:hypothetical protein NQF87_08390 [Bombella sp. TMW 2.2559]|uniref:Uncharacterized protein n=1 Tax=Bombella dulcis TaxID=2967339 RepID=A0ABT3WF63_9PROT|nr:hypothetical protein [Bombella dulcis]MCX5616359.1 hypothetical protein [Bombella dulcis]MCX5616984.1 hypothetical protein [Bombella dulcis]
MTEEKDNRPARQADITDHEQRITRLEANERHQNEVIASLQTVINTQFAQIQQALSSLQSWQGRAFTVAGATGAAIVAAVSEIFRYYHGG